MIYIKNKGRGKVRGSLFEKNAVRIACLHTLKKEGMTGRFSVSIMLTNPKVVRELNHKFRGINKTTDVLSFPLESGDAMPSPSPHKELGDIAVDCKQVAYQAGEHGLPYMYELCYMIIHSTLHLLGYDHMTEEDDAIMTDKQEQYIKELEEMKLWE